MNDAAIDSSRQNDLLQCHYCGMVQHRLPAASGEVLQCCNCHSVLERHHADSVSRALAFSLAALMLYVPANLFPVIRLEVWGHVQQNTVWSGIVALARSQMFGIAIIVLLASIVVPFIKIIGMITLCITARSRRLRRPRTILYKIIDKTGHWSMLDIFLVAILVALLKLGDLAYAVPGPGLAYFTAMVICTMFASANFDPKVIWEENNER